MLHTKSESDITSLAASSPSRSPKRPAYYVQSPSRDSHDGDKSTSMHPTPGFNSPMDSPSHQSFGRHSRNSSASRFSGLFRSSSERKNGRKRNDKGWPECDVILEEGNYDEFDDDKLFTRRFQALMALCGFVLLFTVFCLIIWGAGRNYRAEVTVKSLVVYSVYMGSGSDFTGVPTKMFTVNGTLRVTVYNPATFYGIHVSSSPVNLEYSNIVVATGELKKYYQRRKSHRSVLVNIEGTKVPIYGAGSNLVQSQSANGIQVPLTLDFEIRSEGDVVGKLVRTKHRRHVTCSLVIDSTSNKPIKFLKDSCDYS